MPFVNLVLAYLAGVATVLVLLLLWAAVWMSRGPDDHDPLD